MPSAGAPSSLTGDSQRTRGVIVASQLPQSSWTLALLHSRVKTPLPGAVSLHAPSGSPTSVLRRGGNSYSTPQPSQADPM